MRWWRRLRIDGASSSSPSSRSLMARALLRERAALLRDALSLFFFLLGLSPPPPGIWPLVLLRPGRKRLGGESRMSTTLGGRSGGMAVERSRKTGRDCGEA